ncbi:MAG: hypothetical protein QOI15_1788 [Pseudonocardiales bacterium]|jgi:hypothetical protein|nr:hypothetical protein [Pseudonocardiales bacterium]MDT4920886.1 hypothetical protein [Pseudonocardiales bacterium]
MCEQCDYLAANAGRASEATLEAEFRRMQRARIRDLIDRGSWLVTLVEDWPWLAYTVGLWSRGHPEICVSGMRTTQAHALLNEIAQRVVDGLPIADGDEIVCDHGLPMMAFRVPKPELFVPQANWFYRRKPRNSVPALQLVYPDAHGTWPWEPDCHLFPGAQPMPGDDPYPD